MRLVDSTVVGLDQGRILLKIPHEYTLSILFSYMLYLILGGSQEVTSTYAGEQRF